jgi:antirestriction protein ArdC
VPRAERDKAEEEQKRVPFLKRRDVFNVEQTADLPSHVYHIPPPVPIAEAMEHVQAFLHTLGADVRHGGDRAGYIPALDIITLPPPEAFRSAPDYYATSLHEHTHWVGHPSRLNRNLSGRFGDQAYAAEELVAELGAAYLSAILSIPGKLQHAEYIGNWITLLQHDQRALFTASARATEAARYLEEKGGIGGPAGTDDEAEDTP